ncbi:hypothetical protein D3C79_959700 [compost metagenome]
MFDPDHVRAVEYAAAGHGQAVVGHAAFGAAMGAVAHTLAGFVDVERRALHETHTHRLEQRLQRRSHGVHVGLVEPWAHMQFGLRREQRHLDIRTAMQVQLADSAQGAPQAGETCANDQDVFHRCAPGRSG